MSKITSIKFIIIVLWVSVLTSLFMNPNYDSTFVIGIVSLIIVTLTQIKFPNLSFAILFMVLFLSIFYIIRFSYAFGSNFGFINLISLVLFCILFFAQIDRILLMKKQWIDIDESDVQEQRQNNVKTFKNNFRNLSVSELENKLKSNHIVEEAKIAIEELLKEKK